MQACVPPLANGLMYRNWKEMKPHFYLNVSKIQVERGSLGKKFGYLEAFQHAWYVLLFSGWQCFLRMCPLVSCGNISNFYRFVTTFDDHRHFQRIGWAIQQAPQKELPLDTRPVDVLPFTLTLAFLGDMNGWSSVTTTCRRSLRKRHHEPPASI